MGSWRIVKDDFKNMPFSAVQATDAVAQGSAVGETGRQVHVPVPAIGDGRKSRVERAHVVASLVAQQRADDGAAVLIELLFQQKPVRRTSAVARKCRESRHVLAP